jgi:hypothetical protein
VNKARLRLFQSIRPAIPAGKLDTSLDYLLHAPDAMLAGKPYGASSGRSMMPFNRETQTWNKEGP